MAKILKALKTVAEKLGAANAALASAKKVYEQEHATAHRINGKLKKAQNTADKLRRQGHLKKAEAKDARALSLARKKTAAGLRVQQAIGEVKRLTARVSDLETTEAELIARKKELQGKVTINGNKATGGTKAKRLQTVALASAAKCASGKRRNFYSQAGSWDVDHCITGESYGERSDCSSWFTSVYKSCDLPDPNANDYRGGYTGTLGTHGKAITRAEASRTPGAAVLFGSAPFHHVELALGDGTEHTIGHGSAPVDMGTFSLLPGPVSFRKY